MFRWNCEPTAITAFLPYSRIYEPNISVFWLYMGPLIYYWNAILLVLVFKANAIMAKSAIKCKSTFVGFYFKRSAVVFLAWGLFISFCDSYPVSNASTGSSGCDREKCTAQLSFPKGNALCFIIKAEIYLLGNTRHVEPRTPLCSERQCLWC